MANESGDMKLFGNFSKLIELVSANADYNPANTALSVASLNVQTAASAAISDVGAGRICTGADSMRRRGKYQMRRYWCQR
jgi:hypothetical protein